tara:strand:+ start:9547 stop:9828 length:282 start_codon:yes stop_codon:yes gene_type:complete
MHQFDPRQPLTFSEPDPDRSAKERALHAMSNDDLLALYNLTRAEASAAQKTHDMEKVYPLVRGMKTLQRITGERGFIIRARRISPSPSGRGLG